MSDQFTTPDSPPEELVTADDSIIGRAFRWSILVVLIIAVVVMLAVWQRGRRRPVTPPKAANVEVAKPREVKVQPPALPFTDITAQAGIEFVHVNGAKGDKLLPETMGGGVAFFDFDNDHDADILLVNATDWPGDGSPSDGSLPTPALYRNDGTGRFENVTDGSGMDLSYYGTGVAVGDYDNDGQVDVFLSAVGPNHLFHNLGGGRFEEVTKAAGVAGGEASWSTSSAFFDYDNDGDLDLFVGNYVRWSREIDFSVDYRLVGLGRAYGPPMNFEGRNSYLYRNDGGGAFTDVSSTAGIEIDNPATGRPVGKALGVLPVDVDRDGWIDLFVANDTVRNFFFHNQGDGTFKEEAIAYGLAFDHNGSATGAMGVDAGLYRNDDSLAFAIGNFANEMTTLYASMADRTLFSDEAMGEGIGAPTRSMLTFGLFFFDCDLDGRLDLLQVNGHLEERINLIQPSQHYRQAAQLFWNAGPTSRGCFVPVPPSSARDLHKTIVGRGAAYADIDGDGDLDVLLTQVAARPLLLRNDQDLHHHWLRLKLVGRRANRDAIGAWVEVDTQGSIRRAQVMPARSYLSQVELPVTVGLGEADHVDGLRVIWPDGTVQDVTEVRIDTLMVISQSESDQL